MRHLLGAILLGGPAIFAGVGPDDSDGVERIEVRVTAIAGDGIYVDRGRDAGIEPGDPIDVFTRSGATVRGTIRSVSRRSSRVELAVAGDEVEIGDRGEVSVPADRLWQDDTPAGSAQDGPGERPPSPEAAEHPPWERSLEDWNRDTPLLAPVSEREPEDRDPRLRGRIFTQLDSTRDREFDKSYGFLRTGVDLTYDNPFGRGGELALDGDFYRRSAGGGFTDVEEGRLRFDRLSYRWGGLRGRTDRWEAGRFLQEAFPELGVIDGVELDHRLDSGNLVGASIGLLPEWDDEMQTGEDVQAAVFYRYVSGAAEELSTGIGYQKTWHKGAADRDLVLWNAALRPDLRTSLWASAWIDYYTPSDQSKSPGLELTQLQVNASRHWTSTGAGLFITHFKWPDLERDDAFDLSPQEIAQSEVTRIGLSGWQRLDERFRLDGRISHYEDQDGDGGAAEVGVSARNWLYERGSVRLTVFDTEGRSSSGFGMRMSADRVFDRGLLRLSLDVTRFEQEDLAGSETLLLNTLRGSYDVRIWRSWDLSVYGEERFGDEQSSQSVGLMLQKRL